MSDPNLPVPPFPPGAGIPPYGQPFPMTFGQILDRIFRLVRSHFPTLIGIGMLPFGTLLVFEAIFFGALALAGAFRHPTAQPNIAAMLWIMIPAGLVFIPMALAIYGLYYGATTYATVQADQGFPVTAGEALRHGWSRLGRYVWLMFLRSLIIALPMLAIVLAAAIGGALIGLTTARNASPAALFFLIPLGILFYLCAIVYVVVMSLRFSLAFPACVQENLSAGQALTRSSELTKGAKGRIFLVLLLIYAISYAFIMVLYVVGLFVFAIAALAGAGHMSATAPLTIVLAVLGGLLFLAFLLVWTATLMAAYSTAFAVFYRDQRLRKEGPPPAFLRVDAHA